MNRTNGAGEPICCLYQLKFVIVGAVGGPSSLTMLLRRGVWVPFARPFETRKMPTPSLHLSRPLLTSVALNGQRALVRSTYVLETHTVSAPEEWSKLISLGP